MLTHVVFFKFPDLEVAREAQARLLSMQGRIPSLLSIEAGVDVTRSGRSYDLALITRHADVAGLDAYQVHPAHEVVVQFVRSASTGSVAVDFISD
jgi:Stress responsive A/B Barrel Domain